MGEWRSEYRGLVGKSEGKRPLGRSRRKWENNNGSSGSGKRGMDWIALAQDRARRRALVNAVMNIRVLQNAGNYLTG
jgi:hypothetical protein